MLKFIIYILITISLYWIVGCIVITILSMFLANKYVDNLMKDPEYYNKMKEDGSSDLEYAFFYDAIHKGVNTNDIALYIWIWPMMLLYLAVEFTASLPIILGIRYIQNNTPKEKIKYLEDPRDD